MAFHAHSGWFFERLEDGDVRMTLRRPLGPGPDEAAQPSVVVEDVTFDPDTWASIVASVSASGDNAVTFAEAASVHAALADSFAN